MPQAAGKFSNKYIDTLNSKDLPKPVNDRSTQSIDHSIEHLRKRIKSVRLERLMAQQLEAELELGDHSFSTDHEAMAEIEGRSLEIEIGELARKMVSETYSSPATRGLDQAPSANLKKSSRIREGIEIASLLASKSEALTEFLDQFDREFSALEETQKKLELLEEKYVSLVEEQECRAEVVTEQKEHIKFLELRLTNIMSVLDATRENMHYLENLVERRNQEVSKCRKQLAEYAVSDVMP